MSRIVRIDTLKLGDKKSCSANGDGVRIVVWFSGCDVRCEGCHNRDFWDFDNPKFPEFSESHLKIIEKEMNRFPLYSGLSILGGEPLSTHNAPDCLKLCKWYKEKFPEKNIWIWSGHTYEQLLEQEGEHGNIIKKIFSYCDFLVDGPFIMSQRDISLKFRGSKNQRIIPLREFK